MQILEKYIESDENPFGVLKEPEGEYFDKIQSGRLTRSLQILKRDLEASIEIADLRYSFDYLAVEKEFTKIEMMVLNLGSPNPEHILNKPKLFTDPKTSKKLLRLDQMDKQLNELQSLQHDIFDFTDSLSH